MKSRSRSVPISITPFTRPSTTSGVPSSGIAAPHAALSRPVEVGAPGWIPAEAVIVPVTEASVAAESTT